MKYRKWKDLKLPIQSTAKNNYIHDHGCSLVATCIGLQWAGRYMPMSKVKSYATKHLHKGSHVKYPLSECAKMINQIMPSKPATPHKGYNAESIRTALRAGKMILFEENDPVHSVALVRVKGVTYRLSYGKATRTTVNKAVRRRCTSPYYKGWVSVRKGRS